MGRLTLQAGPLFHLLPGKPNRSHEALRKNLTGLLTSPNQLIHCELSDQDLNEPA